MVTKATLNLKGLDEYLEELAKAGRDIDAASQRALMAGANVLLPEMLARVPVDRTSKKRKPLPRLKSMIRIAGPFQNVNFNFVRVGVIMPDKDTAIKANVQEYGAPSKNIPAQPYLRPAIDAKRRAVMRRIRASLKAEGLTD